MTRSDLTTADRKLARELARAQAQCHKRSRVADHPANHLIHQLLARLDEAYHLAKRYCDDHPSDCECEWCSALEGEADGFLEHMQYIVATMLRLPAYLECNRVRLPEKATAHAG